MESHFLIFEINTKHYSFKDCDHPKIIDRIITKYKIDKKIKEEKTTFNKLNKENLTYYLFGYRVSEERSNWSQILPDELSENVDFKLETLNLLLFISYDYVLFVICGGKTFQSIVGFTVPNFGISMISKILDEEKDSILSIDTRGITGVTAKSSNQYKKKLKLINFAKFGKIPTDMLFVLNSKSSLFYFEHLKLKKDEEIKIEGGRGLKIKKGMNFELLHKTLISFTHIYSLEEKDYLSSYEKLSDEKVKTVNLDQTLIDELYNAASNLISDKPVYSEYNFDFIHPSNHLEFIQSDYFILKEKIKEKNYVEFDRVNDPAEIFNTVLIHTIRKQGVVDNFTFKVQLRGTWIEPYMDNIKKKSGRTTFIKFINAEIKVFDRHYIYIDDGWYFLKNSFLKELNQSAVYLLRDKKLPKGILKLGWDKKLLSKESEYNISYSNLDNYLVFDTIVPDNIEPCDIFYYDDTGAYFIHVKYGFNEALRSLSNQVILAAKTIKSDIDSGEFKYLKKAYTKLDVPRINFDEFKSICKNKKIHFVFAFCHNRNLPVEDRMEQMSSNIAKYALLECNSNMIETGANIYFKQIMSEDET